MGGRESTIVLTIDGDVRRKVKVGLVLSSSAKTSSVKHVMASIREALADHDLVYPPPSLAWAPEVEQQRLAADFVRSCDAIVGLLHPAILAARQRIESRVPYLFLMLGTLPRGAFDLREHLPRISTRDTFIVNSSADLKICARFFENARVAWIPLAYDAETFHPVEEGERAELRSELGFGSGSRVLLYAGRITPEKNLYAVLRAFGALVDAVPDLHLVLAGRITPVPFREFGVSPHRFPESLARAAERLVPGVERVLFAGSVSAVELRELYGAADVAINLTLHHDENFGLAQVEAMACGTPVVGSAWGGLKDTIMEGRTGFRVSTAATPLGVKVNWWEAANRVLELLRDPVAARRVGEEAATLARTRYSPEPLRTALLELLRERTGQAELEDDEPVEATDLARELWAVCDPSAELRPPFRRGERALELYRLMIEPYTGLSPAGVPAGEPLAASHLLCLATPLTLEAGRTIRLDDPLYPLECDLPERVAPVLPTLLELLRREPVTSLERLGARISTRRELEAALEWMIRTGLLLRSKAQPGWLDPRAADGRLGEPLLTFQRLARGVDFAVAE